LRQNEVDVLDPYKSNYRSKDFSCPVGGGSSGYNILDYVPTFGNIARIAKGIVSGED